jgi:aminobenzoyl-glutamate transport protein
MSDKVVEPSLGAYHGDQPHDESEGVSVQESKGLRAALFATLGVGAVIALLTLPSGAPLRNPETGAIVGNSPFMDSLIILIMLMFLAAGAAFGRAAGTITSIGAAIKAVEKTFAGLGGLIFLFLVISQFLAHFNYTNMATLAAVNLADALEGAAIGAVPLLVGFVVVTCIIDLIMTGAIPKWAIFAPIFVPLFMRLGIGPEAVLAAYRVGDSPFNSVTPLMGYFGLVLVFTQRYKPDAGVGTVVAMMLPYIHRGDLPGVDGAARDLGRARHPAGAGCAGLGPVSIPAGRSPAERRAPREGRAEKASSNQRTGVMAHRRWRSAGRGPLDGLQPLRTNRGHATPRGASQPVGKEQA